MSRPWFPDAAASRAVLIGVSRYESGELPPIPAVRANLADLRAALTDPAAGTLTGGGCRVLGDDAIPAEVGRALAEASREASDLLLVYYAGHGLLDEDGRLHLALRTTSGEHPGWTAIPIDLIKRELGRATARARVLVLDCCFSGTAVEAMADPAGLAAGQLRLTGTFTLTSTTANEPSNAPLGSRHTAFTGALLDALKSPQPLTLEGIYRHTDDTLTGLGLPRPQCRSVNSARELALVRGPAPQREPGPAAAPAAHAEPPPDPATPPEPAPPRPDHAGPAQSAPPPTAPPRLAPMPPEPAAIFPLEPSRPAPQQIGFSIAMSSVFAAISWIAFTDPFRNADPAIWEIVLAALFGLFFAVVAVMAAATLIVGFRPASATWTTLEIDPAGVVLVGPGRRNTVSWKQIRRLTVARPTIGPPAVLLVVRPDADPGDINAKNGRVTLGRCKQWPALSAAARRAAPAFVAVDRPPGTRE